MSTSCSLGMLVIKNKTKKFLVFFLHPKNFIKKKIIIDAGKSTISGNLLYLTGMVDERMIEKFKREAQTKGRDSWFLAYIMDSFDEEKDKGKTVEVGRAHFETEKKRYTLLDAPGHQAYVPNMILAAAQADAGKERKNSNQKKNFKQKKRYSCHFCQTTRI